MLAAISAYSSTAEGLRAQQDCLAFWLVISTAVVAVGLVIEVGAETWRLFIAFSKWIWQSSGTFDRSTLNKAAIGGLLITIGVVGEGYVEFRSSIIQTDLRNANARALADANKRTDAEISARLKLTLALMPHFLNAQDKKEIADLCRPFANPSIQVEVRTTYGTGLALGIQISDALKSAGFATRVQPTKEALFEVTTAGPDEHLRALIAITQALGKKVSIVVDSHRLPPGSPIVITVGERPIWNLPP